ncbi:hypothetical protein FQA39_LY03517 [Lamprigera yunnana]|nr:hypothetical protein FQA39_LY03517 [Lamprigera yunnana]
MVKQCFVCAKYFMKGKNVSFHLLPKGGYAKNQWFSVFEIGEDAERPKYTYFCSNHFHDSDFVVKPSGIKYLKQGAIPSTNPIKESNDDKITSSQSGALNNTASNQSNTDSVTLNMPQQGNSSRTTATVHPYNLDGRTMSTRQAAALYNQNIYQQYQHYAQKQQQNVMNTTYPVHPDVKFRRLPFFDVIADLLKPASLVPQNSQRLQETQFYFHLTPQQATDVAASRDIRPGSKCEYIKQVQLRFCLLETTCEQEDLFPPNVVVKVNNKICPLPNPIPTNKPGVEPKRPPRPVNITPMVKLSPMVANVINVSWAADYNRGYAITVALVHKRSSNDLLNRLKSRGIKHSDHTRGLIKEKLNEDADCEIATTCLRVSLMCPLGKMRMSTPCRAITCQHLQCFDASLFLQMNERKPTWNCPVCDKPALYDNLVIDGYFQDVLSLSSNDVSEIQLHKDGAWSSQVVDKKAPAKVEKLGDDSIEIISDDLDIVNLETSLPEMVSPVTNDVKSPRQEKAAVEEPRGYGICVDLTTTDSEDDEPLAKRRATNPKPDSTIKFLDTTSVSSSSNQSRVTTTPGPSSVSSSGYPASPFIINLDSPSPPTSPQTTSMSQIPTPVPSACMLMSNGTTIEPITAMNNIVTMPFLDLDAETNNGSLFSF